MDIKEEEGLESDMKRGCECLSVDDMLDRAFFNRRRRNVFRLDFKQFEFLDIQELWTVLELKLKSSFS